MWTFEQAETFFNGRRHRERDWRKVKTATVVRKLSDNTYAIVYHDTAVVTIRRDGSYTLDTGGWATPTTKSRIQEFSPVRFARSRRHVLGFGDVRSVWEVYSGVGVGVVEFRNGMVLDSGGTVLWRPTLGPPVYHRRSGRNPAAWQNRALGEGNGSVTGRLAPLPHPGAQNMSPAPTPSRRGFEFYTASLSELLHRPQAVNRLIRRPPTRRVGFDATLAAEGRVPPVSMLAGLAATEERIKQRR